MKEHPIIFSTEMLESILKDRKTQTRRVIKPQPDVYDQFSSAYKQGIKPEPKPTYCEGNIWAWFYPKESHGGGMEFYCPYGQVGSRLWLRETWATDDYHDGIKPSEIPQTATIYHIERTGKDIIGIGKIRSSRFMCRWMSRITLEITGVRVERLQDITEKDCQSEGLEVEYAWRIEPTCLIKGKMKDRFARLWDSINDKRGYGWKENPWVWVIEFRRLKP